MDNQVLQEIRDELRDSLAIMDEKGKRNPEDNAEMLWDKDWEHLRELILDCHDRIKRHLEAEHQKTADAFDEWLSRYMKRPEGK